MAAGGEPAGCRTAGDGGAGVAGEWDGGTAATTGGAGSTAGGTGLRCRRGRRAGSSRRWLLARRHRNDQARSRCGRRQVQRRGQTIRQFGDEIDQFAAGRVHVVPAAIGGARQHHGEQQERSAGNAAFRGRLRQVKLRLGRQSAGGFLLEAAQHELGIESQMLGIGPEEAVGVGGAGKVAEAALLDRFQIGQTDAESYGDFAQLIAQGHPPAAEHVADAGSPCARRTPPSFRHVPRRRCGNSFLWCRPYHQPSLRSEFMFRERRKSDKTPCHCR